MRYPKLRELKEAIIALIKGPYTSRFPYQPHLPAEGFRGKSEFHKDDCIGCGACFQVCPSRAIDMQDISGKRVLTVNWELCVFCGQCQANCPTEKGIMLSREFDLATTEKGKGLSQTIEKELGLCDCCGEVIAPLDQMLWVAKKLGALAFANIGLVFFYMRGLDLSMEEKSPVKREGPFNRSDRIKIICPRCRREAVLQS